MIILVLVKRRPEQKKTIWKMSNLFIYTYECFTYDSLFSSSELFINDGPVQMYLLVVVINFHHRKPFRFEVQLRRFWIRLANSSSFVVTQIRKQTYFFFSNLVSTILLYRIIQATQELTLKTQKWIYTNLLYSLRPIKILTLINISSKPDNYEIE